MICEYYQNLRGQFRGTVSTFKVLHDFWFLSTGFSMGILELRWTSTSILRPKKIKRKNVLTVKPEAIICAKTNKYKLTASICNYDLYINSFRKNIHILENEHRVLEKWKQLRKRGRLSYWETTQKPIVLGFLKANLNWRTWHSAQSPKHVVANSLHRGPAKSAWEECCQNYSLQS